MTFTDRVLEALGPAFRERAGELLPDLVAALCGELDAVDDLMSPGNRTWAKVFDLDVTPYPALIGQAAGTPVPAGLSLEQQRAYVRARTSWRRGTPAAMAAAVQALLTGTQRVDIIERDGTPWRLSIRVWQPETTATAAEIRAAATTQKPVGIVIDQIHIDPGASYRHMRDEHGPTYADLTDFLTIRPIARHVPERFLGGLNYAQMAALAPTYPDWSALYPDYKSARDDEEI